MAKTPPSTLLDPAATDPAPDSAPATVNSPADLAVPVPAINAAQLDTVDATPFAGGSYTRDPATGVLTLVTPSALQE